MDKIFDKIPKYVKEVVNEIEAHNFEAHIVGGAIRDILLDRTPSDFDIATNALPNAVRHIFKKTIPTGEAHGTITVIHNGNSVEVTTYRVEGDYEKNRKPSSVTFVNSIEEDLSRRDFTINAMAYRLKHRAIIDPFNGINDLDNKIIRTVNSPQDRFREDALRILRAVRFATTYGFLIQKGTYDATLKLGHLLNNISKERVRDEFVKIILSDDPAFGIKLLKYSDLLEYIVPELLYSFGFDQQNPHHSKDVFNHTMSVLNNTDKNLHLRLSALFHDIGKPFTFSKSNDGVGHFYDHHVVGENIVKHRLRELRFDNETVCKVALLVREHMSRYPHLRKASVKKFLARVGVENINNLFSLQRADIFGSAHPHDFSIVDNLEKEVNRILTEKEPFGIKDLAISGHDLLEMGIPSEPIMGKILNFALEQVIEDPKKNTLDDLKVIAIEFYNRFPKR